MTVGKSNVKFAQGDTASGASIKMANAYWSTNDSPHAEINAAVQVCGFTNDAHDELYAVREAAPLPVKQKAESSIFAGEQNVAVNGTPEALASTQTLNVGVTVKAKAGNTDIVTVGPTGSVVFELSAKESVFIPVADLATVFVDSIVNGEGVTYIGS